MEGFEKAYRDGVLALEGGSLEQAVTSLEVAVAIDPEYAEALVLPGNGPAPSRAPSGGPRFVERSSCVGRLPVPKSLQRRGACL